MKLGEVFHAVLKISHVAKEVFGEFFDRFDGWSWGYWWTGRGICERICGYGCRRCGVTSNKRGYEDCEEKNRQRENSEKVWI